MPPIPELILYYVPVTLASCLVYASVKRQAPGDIVRTGLRYFVMFTFLIAVLVAVLELLPVIFG